MEVVSDDVCPFCREALKIVCVRFEFSSAKMVLACPNCASAIADSYRDVLSKGNNVARPGRSSRLRHSIAFSIGALVAAAGLRHIIHIYAGFSPAEIRVGAAVLLITVCSLLFVLKTE
jgi:hypothetical protein